MEVEFKELLYAQNNNVNSGYIYLDDVNYVFESGKIYALVGDASEVVGRLVVLDKRPTKGTLAVDGQVIKKTAKVDNIAELKKSLVFIDFGAKYKFAKNTLLEELEFLLGKQTEDIESMARNALLMVGLSDKYFSANLWNLSTSESKKILLAINLCLNPKVMVLKDLERGLIHKDRVNIKRLLLKLKNRYNKMIFIISDSVEFLFDLVDKVLVFNRGVIVIDGGKSVFYNDEFYKYVEKPRIVDFIMYAKSKKHKIEDYIDIKELIKGIYRDVENKK